MGRPAVGKLKDGTWVAIFGNGYNSTNARAKLFVVRMDTGAILAVIPTNNSGASFGSNGLGSTEVVNKTSGLKDTIEYVYGADFKGNIWRFDLSNVTSPTSGFPTTAALVYSTPTGRPITAEIKIGAATGTPSIVGGKMVYFGTGTYLNATDATTTSPSQALYGIYDSLLSTSNATPAVTETDLKVMGINMPSTTSDKRTVKDPSTTINATTGAVTSAATPWYSVTGKKGWVVPLSGTNVVAGERVIAPPVRYTVAGLVDAVLFTSIVPGTDECAAGVDAWITGVDAMTGDYKKVFNDTIENSVKIVGGSPRGVFVLQDGADPTLYISQTIFNDVISTTSFTTSTGGQQSVSINGTVGQTRVLGIKLARSAAAASAAIRQVWRQLK